MNLLKSEKEVFTVMDLSGFLGLHKLTILKLIKEKEINAFRAGGKFLITKASLKQFMGME